MNRDDTIWLAGLLEGEGCFDLHRSRYPRIRLGMKDRDVVGRAATLMGSRVRVTLKPAPHAAMWHTEISGAAAVSLLWTLLPHMGARRSAKIAEILGHATLTTGVTPGPRITRPPALPVG